MMQARELHQISAGSSSSRWWSEETIALVTGANQGIGFEVVKRLSELGVTAVLTARNVEKGSLALDSLRRIGLRNVHFFCLDVSDYPSINAFVSWFRNKFGVLDILVNNAAVSFNDIGENSIHQPEIVIKTNFLGTKHLTESLLPLFRRSNSVSRILNVSSRLASLNKLRNPRLRQTLEDEDLTEQRIDGMVSLFLESVRNRTWKEQGWPEIWPEYAVSKLALNAYSRVLARRYDGQRLSVNCFCPGFTRTSMTRGKGIFTAEESASTIADLVLFPPETLTTGKFYICLEDKRLVSKL